MDRRSFTGLLGAMTATAAHQAGKPAVAPKTKYYVLENYYLKSGTQPERIHAFMRDALLPALNQVHRGPKLFLEALVAPHRPQLAFLAGVGSIDQLFSMIEALWRQEDFRKAVDAWEAHPEPPCEHNAASLLEAAEYSPEIAPLSPPPKTPRIFELRVYHSPTGRRLRAAHELLADMEARVFHRCGLDPLLYASTFFGVNRPNITYLIPFENLAAREKAWTTFAADPDWIKARKESLAQHGEAITVMDISLFRATPYSPIR